MSYHMITINTSFTPAHSFDNAQSCVSSATSFLMCFTILVDAVVVSRTQILDRASCGWGYWYVCRTGQENKAWLCYPCLLWPTFSSSSSSYSVFFSLLPPSIYYFPSSSIPVDHLWRFLYSPAPSPFLAAHLLSLSPHACRFSVPPIFLGQEGDRQNQKRKERRLQGNAARFRRSTLTPKSVDTSIHFNGSRDFALNWNLFFMVCGLQSFGMEMRCCQSFQRKPGTVRFLFILRYSLAH